jgi:hypothetical protein
LIIVNAPTPEPMSVNDIPRQRCHVMYYYQNGWFLTRCEPGAGAVNCPCEEWGTQTPMLQ